MCVVGVCKDCRQLVHRKIVTDTPNGDRTEDYGVNAVLDATPIVVTSTEYPLDFDIEDFLAAVGF